MRGGDGRGTLAVLLQRVAKGVWGTRESSAGWWLPLCQHMPFILILSAPILKCNCKISFAAYACVCVWQCVPVCVCHAHAIQVQCSANSFPLPLLPSALLPFRVRTIWAGDKISIQFDFKRIFQLIAPHSHAFFTQLTKTASTGREGGVLCSYNVNFWPH